MRKTICASLFGILLVSLLPSLAAQNDRGQMSFWAVVERLETNGGAAAAVVVKVGGFPARVGLGPSTGIVGLSGAQAGVEALTAGAIILVTADWTADGFLARSISINDPAEIAVTGVVSRADADRVVVAGQEFLIDNGTVFDRTPAEGEIALVRAGLSSSGALVARGVDAQPQVRIFGAIGGKSDEGQTLQVSGRTVFVTPQTLIQGPAREKLAFADLRAGQFVDIGAALIDGRLTAAKILVFDPARVTVVGTFVSMTAASVQVKVADAVFNIVMNASTQVRGALEPGASVTVEAAVQGDGTLLALSIAAKGASTDGARSATVSGTIDRIEGRDLIVSGTKVKTDSQTAIVSKGQTLSFDALKEGDRVTVTGIKQQDGSFLAQRIEVLPKEPAAGAMRGTITGIGAGYLVIGQDKVFVNSATAIVSRNQTIQLADLKVGDTVEAQVVKQADGSLLAVKIALVTPEPAMETVAGTIQSLGSSSFVVSGVTVVVNAQTVIKSGTGTLGFADLKVGQKVSATGERQRDGSILAAKVEVDTGVSSSTTLEGTIQRKEGGNILVVANARVEVNAQTVILRGGAQITFAELAVGTRVAVYGAMQPNGTILASKIKVL